MKTKTTKNTSYDPECVVIDETKGRKPAKSSTKPAKVKKEKPAKVAKVAKSKAKKDAKPPRIDSGYVAAIRSLLSSGKHTINSMAAEILEQFPDKSAKSVKRIGHNLAKRARQQDPGTNLAWLPSASTNTGYMARIDELLHEGKLTTRQIGEKVAVEFPKEGVEEAERVLSAKKVIRARLKRLIGSGKIKKGHVPQESDIREQVEKETKVAEKKEKKTKKSAGDKAIEKVKASAAAKKGKASKKK